GANAARARRRRGADARRAQPRADRARERDRWPGDGGRAMSEQDRPEGAPSAPSEPTPATHEIPGMRLMALVRWALLLAVMALAGATWWTYVLREQPEVQGEDRFYCPMHPQIRSASPGECSICHMRLEPIPAEGTAS